MRNTFNFWAIAALYLCMATLPVHAQGPTLDPSFVVTSATGQFNPTLPRVADMVRQPDGKLIIAGDLLTVNNSPVNKLCRLLPDGQVDATFNAPPTDGDILSLAIQADGKLLVGGNFANVGGQSRIGIARLLPNGTLDISFQSPFGNTPTFSSFVQKVVIQDTRGILVLGRMTNPNGMGGFELARILEATGAIDPTFQPGFDTFNAIAALVQPNGNLVFAGRPHLIGGQQCNVWGTLPNGALDPAFVPLPGTVDTQGLVRDPNTGNIYVNGGTAGTGLGREPVRLLPNGVRDPGFSTAGTFGMSSPPGFGYVLSMAVQPNGRVLLGGLLPTPAGRLVCSARLLPSGALDPNYQALNGPDGGNSVSKVLVQPDGALVFAGDFTTAGGFGLNCLARMLDPNVLSARAQPATADDLLAWPVPAREVLHLRLPAARVARQLALLDALGRVVRHQAVPAGQAAPTLPTAGLPPGGYLLRVAFAEGAPAYRRITVE